MLANSTFIWYFNAHRTHSCIVSITGSACLPVRDTVFPKRLINRYCQISYFFTDQILLSYIMDPNITYICYFEKRYCSLTQHLLAISTHSCVETRAESYREQLLHCSPEAVYAPTQSTLSDFLFLHESDPIIVPLNVFEQFFFETVRGH